MRKNIELSKEKRNQLLCQFYGYFEDGYSFEEFLKIYLEKIGLDEVVVTKKSSDGGIDLKALRYGVGGFNDIDSVEYFVQAKRNKPGSTVPIEKIRALRGVMSSGSIGIFITTASYSKKTEEFIKDDPTRPIILIDGQRLVESCIEHEIGFVYVPQFSKSAMDELKSIDDDRTTDEIENDVIVVEKQITVNDVRAKILRFPKAVIEKIGTDVRSCMVSFNGAAEKECNIDKSRTYLSGITEFYKNNGLINGDGSFNSAKAIWKMYQDKIIITLKEIG